MYDHLKVIPTETFDKFGGSDCIFHDLLTSVTYWCKWNDETCKFKILKRTTIWNLWSRHIWWFRLYFHDLLTSVTYRCKWNDETCKFKILIRTTVWNLWSRQIMSLFFQLKHALVFEIHTITIVELISTIWQFFIVLRTIWRIFCLLFVLVLVLVHKTLHNPFRVDLWLS